jgi:protein-S-isoprenylcysteine O-methyltransferase Ste14
MALALFMGFTAAADLGAAVDHLRDADLLGALHYLAVAVAMNIMAALLLIRRPPVLRGEGTLPKVVALIGSWTAPFLAIIPLTWDPGWLLVGTTVALILAYVFIIWALLTLKRSFSVFPEARQLIRHGPYGLVRHPLYAAYIMTYAAVSLPRLSLLAVLLAAIGIGAEMWRARFEESVLQKAFPEYAAYAAETPRFLPVPFWRRLAAARKAAA